MSRLRSGNVHYVFEKRYELTIGCLLEASELLRPDFNGLIQNWISAYPLVRMSFSSCSILFSRPPINLGLASRYDARLRPDRVVDNQKGVN